MSAIRYFVRARESPTSDPESALPGKDMIMNRGIDIMSDLISGASNPLQVPGRGTR